MRPLPKRILAQPGMGLSAGQTQGPILVPAVLYSPLGEPVLVASVAASLTPPGQGRLQWQAEKESLARFLAEHLLDRRLPDLTLGRDPLGKPHLWLGASPGPVLSFSWSAGRLWGAIGGPESDLGLDAAAPREFSGSYPYRRVFQEAEWQAALNLTAGDREEAAALLWSVKEAVVKARGCGFHFLGPRQVQAQFTGMGEHGYLWGGYLGAPAPDGTLPESREPCPAASIRLRQVWLSVAWSR